MKRSDSVWRISRIGAVGAVGAVIALTGLWLADGQVTETSHKSRDRARVAITQALPAMDGAHLKVTLVEVNYAPGEASPPHSHPCPVIGYVAEGAIRSQVKGGDAAVYQVGQTFYEPANGVHVVSANASATAPAVLLAYFLCDRDEPLSVNVPAEGK